MIEVSNASLNT